MTPLSFLFFWELMTLVPAAIILVGTATEAARHTVFTYVAITHLGGAGTWIALLLLAHEGAIGDPTALAEGSGVQAVIAVAAIVGFGTKAGLMPMHAWLPRAHPIAPAYVSALMSGVMVAVAAYGLDPCARRLARAAARPGSARPCSCSGGLSALGGITYALFQRDLKRLLAYSTVEHLGIVALGLGACLLLRRHGADQWAAFALGGRAAAHRQPRRLQGAAVPRRRRVRAGDRRRSSSTASVGLLRRLPWSGGAFLVGALAIAGHPAAQRLRLRMADAAGAPPRTRLRGRLGRDARSGRARGARGDDGARRALLRQGDRARAARAAAPVGVRRARSSRRGRCASRSSLWRAPASSSAPSRASSSRGSSASRPGPTPASPVRPGLELPGTGNLPDVGFLVVVCGLTALLWLARGSRRAAPSPTWASGQPIEPPLLWTSAGFSKPLRLVLEAVLRPEREIETTTTRRRRAGGVATPGVCPT